MLLLLRNTGLIEMSHLLFLQLLSLVLFCESLPSASPNSQRNKFKHQERKSAHSTKLLLFFFILCRFQWTLPHFLYLVASCSVNSVCLLSFFHMYVVYVYIATNKYLPCLHVCFLFCLFSLLLACFNLRMSFYFTICLFMSRLLFFFHFFQFLLEIYQFLNNQFEPILKKTFLFVCFCVIRV